LPVISFSVTENIYNLTKLEKSLMGVSEKMVWVSVGIEAMEDIIEDFTAAVETI
jgi:O-acetylhomoserine/O-acetylserine sulfhydrylase-like pyridoxal-dependent enzyme